MPKEQGQCGERPPRGASKNAKDKSNSATLRASQGGIHREQSGMGDIRMLRRDSEWDSEKDSGFSEASSEDQRSSVSEPHRANTAGHNLPNYEGLTQIYVIKNLMVKPSRQEQLLHGPLTWGGDWHSFAGPEVPTQLLLIQQPAIPASSSCTPPSTSSLSTPPCQVKRGGKKSYLPILNSYPRIAPHPRKEDTGATWVKGVKESASEGQSQRKRVCTEEEQRETVSTSSHLLKHQQQQQKEAQVQSKHKDGGGHSSSHCPSVDSSTHPKPHHCKQSSASKIVGSPSISSSQTPSPPSSSDTPLSSSPPSSATSSSHSPYRLNPNSSSTRQRRFLNTAEILNQSGLLAITLRTKELLKQNATTEREIAQLRQHTHLFCQVAQASQSRCHRGYENLSKLLQAMTESDFYPNLDMDKVLNNNHPESKTRSEEDQEKDYDIRISKTHTLASVYGLDEGASPPSPLFAPSPEREQADPMSTSLSASRSDHSQRSRQGVMDTMFPESPTQKLL
ncbi:CLOCK-interacting pacemaker-like [Aulostomus maculatus]